jgi:transposase-like protein
VSDNAIRKWVRQYEREASLQATDSAGGDAADELVAVAARHRIDVPGPPGALPES